MWTASRHSGFRSIVILFAGVTGLLLHDPPCGANPGPEPEVSLLVHVQPVSGSCETSITDYHQIIHSTTTDGPLEFLIFLMVVENPWPSEEISLLGASMYLTWPENWELLDFDPCAGDGAIDPDRQLHVEWSDYPASDEEGGVVLVARLMMNVVGPGQLDCRFGYPFLVVLNLHGYDWSVSGPLIGAEAGMPTPVLPVSWGRVKSIYR